MSSPARLRQIIKLIFKTSQFKYHKNLTASPIQSPHSVLAGLCDGGIFKPDRLGWPGALYRGCDGRRPGDVQVPRDTVHVIRLYSDAIGREIYLERHRIVEKLAPSCGRNCRLPRPDR